jgi:hypothetical protein
MKREKKVKELDLFDKLKIDILKTCILCQIMHTRNKTGHKLPLMNAT